MRIAIIGSGIGGLGAALKLSKEGHTVTLFEKNDILGGRAGVFKEAGFTFDMGPSWYLMPDVFEKFFASIGENIHDHLNLVQLDPSYRIFFEKKAEPVDVPFSVDKAADLAESFEMGAGNKFKKYIKKTGKQYKLVVGHFLYRDYNSFFSLFNSKNVQALFTLPFVGGIDRYIKTFFKSKYIRQMLEYTTVFLGTSPYNAPAMYAMMAYVDFGLGVFYPQGGINTLITALVNLSKKSGVTFETNMAVQKIEVQNGQARALIFQNGSRQEFDVIISNADMHFTETQLLEEKDQTYSQKYWDNVTMAPSALLLYLGIKGELPELRHHNLYFADNWDEHFDDIFKNPKWPNNPSYYISNPSKTDPSVAPIGYENVFVLVPLAPHFGTSQESSEYVDFMLDHISKTIGVKDLKQRIIYKKIFGPDGFKDRYNSFGGTALGLAHTLNQTAFFRPHNKSKKISNLYYVGAGVHPGIGMPVCLISAELVAKRIQKEIQKQ